MKNRLLPLFVVLASFSARSQVGIGIKNPNPSTELHVVAADKGILIPNVKLTSTTVYSPIVGAETNSLLVFATDEIGDIKPGYYYWFDHKWNRLAISGEAGSGTGKDGKVGVAEGVVPPGAKGTSTYPGDDINIYTNTASGIVYVQKSDGTWTPINGKDGKDGMVGGTGAPGTVLVRDNKKFFLKMFKRKFKDEFEFSEDSFLLKNESKSTDFDRSIYVIYDKNELIEFLKLDKKGKNVMVCFFNQQLHNSLIYFDEIKNLKLIDASKSRTELLNDLNSYFKNTSDFITKIPDTKFSTSGVYQNQFENFQKALFFMM
ncbi:hypothetical protein [Flavobacterium defluvii]|uniref:Uncharacterized protein n=1 Tax=Flavobacterium defluvii TaxID=370979 RepID=A0A1M5VKE8_9FLAO|nr:hypothetical protein [Flavobacterium defluvii]SHH75701.1 hypothetical protein SAMN05443663_11140 [Flavobacterium defluvii]